MPFLLAMPVAGKRHLHAIQLLSLFACQLIQNVNAAMRFLVNNSEKYGIDTSAMIIGGSSGGALLTLTIAYMNQQDFDKRFPWQTKSLGRLDNSTNEIKTTFRFRGVVDMRGQILDTSYISSDEAYNIY